MPLAPPGSTAPIVHDAAGRSTAKVRLSQRCRLPEMMDDPNLDAGEHRAALAGLRRLNWISGSGNLIWSALRRLAAQQSRPLRVLDVASGGGDVLVQVARRAHRAGVTMVLDGCDYNPRAVRFAEELTSEQSCGQHRFFCCDVLNDALPKGYDVVMCSLFLHHLERVQATDLLSKMAAASEQAILVNDLHRTRIGYLLVSLGCHLLSRSPVVHSDGPLSVRAAWTVAEAQMLAREAGLVGAEVTHQSPVRFLMQWKRPVEQSKPMQRPRKSKAVVG